MHKNTFPPLISGSSVDFLGQRQLLGGKVLDSLVIQSSSTDTFFNPQLGLTGYGSDGYFYTTGKKDMNLRASWYEEPSGPSRGPLKSFPQSALVILTDASIGIMDLTSSLDMWMLFLRLDQGAFGHNVFGQEGYTPTKLSYANGAIIVNMTSDPGSATTGNSALVIDLVKDCVWLAVSPSDHDAPAPNTNTGYLLDEVDWLRRMGHAIYEDSFGRLTRMADGPMSPNATGTWEVFGYTPTGTTVDDNHELRHYSQVTKTGPRTLEWTGPVNVNGTWDLSGAPVLPSDRYWSLELVRKADQVVVAQLDLGAGLVRSWAVPRNDSAYSSLKNLCYIEDHVLASYVAMDSASPDLNLYILALLRAQNPDGSWDMAYDAATGLSINPGHKSLGATASALYMLASAYSGASAAIKAAIVSAIGAGLTYVGTLRNLTGPQAGLYSEGFGRVDSYGTYHAEVQDQCWLVSQVWLYAALLKAAGLVSTSTTSGALATAMESLWLGDRYAQGIGSGGTDNRETAKSRAFSVLFCLLSGQTGRFASLYAGLKAYERTNSDTIGLCNQTPEYGYADSPIWGVATNLGTALSARNASTVGSWPINTTRALELRGGDSGWVGGSVFRTEDSWVEWANTEATAWAALAHRLGTKTSFLG